MPLRDEAFDMLFALALAIARAWASLFLAFVTLPADRSGEVSGEGGGALDSLVTLVCGQLGAGILSLPFAAALSRLAFLAFSPPSR